VEFYKQLMLFTKLPVAMVADAHYHNQKSPPLDPVLRQTTQFDVFTTDIANMLFPNLWSLLALYSVTTIMMNISTAFRLSLLRR
jgi:hypothetical protein